MIYNILINEIIELNVYINKKITLNFIKKYSYNWNYYYLSKNPNITEEFILKYPYKNWDIKYLIKNNKITDFKALSKFINITEYIIDNYPNKPWDWKWIIENTNISVEKHIQLDLIKKYSYKWNYKKLSKNPNITKEFILKYPYQNWNNKINKSQEWIIENTNISVEKYIQLDLIEKYPYKWNYYYLSKNPNITKEFILKYPYQNWDIEYLINNNKITDFKILSKFKYIDDYFIIKYINKQQFFYKILN